MFGSQNFNAKFIVLNGIMLSLFAAGIWAGWFTGFLALGIVEYAMLVFLFVYFLGGAIAAIYKNWLIVRHVANGLPMWALAFTGIGIINAAVGLTGTSTEALIIVFKNLALAIAPNIVGVLFMVWLREIALWCGHEET